MTNNKDFDYKNTHFEVPELTRIHGEPTTATLITLQREVRANALSVNTTLGGGAHGHLGLVCSAAVYATIPNTAVYTRPNSPGALTITQNGATQYTIAQERDQHEELTRIFREMIAVERTIIQQIVAVVDPKFLKAIRNTHTNKINKTIPEIFEYLFDTYGDVTIQELTELKNQVENLTFNPREPIDNVFTEIEDLADIADIAKSPLTEQQKIDFAYLILQQTNKFNSGLKKWNVTPAATKTWQYCKERRLV